MQEHLRDYVWMALPGSAPEKVPAVVDQISRKMAAGYSQVFLRDGAMPFVEEPQATEEEQQ